MYAERTDAGRRFLCRALPAAVAVWGMLWAATAEAYQPTAKADLKAEVKDDEMRYEFAMSGKPWKDVFVWLNEKTGLPIVGQAIPTGTFNLVGPANKKYTMAEVLDLVNSGLLANEDTQKYLLIRREHDMVVVPADQKKLGPLAPLVKLEDLHKYGKSQFVTVMKPLTSLVADEVRDDFAKSLSVFGEIVAMKPNSLKISDQVSTIEFILAMIKEAEDAERNNSDSYSHVCKYVRASEVERQLKELLPDAEKIAKFGSSTTPAPQPGMDPRFAPRPNVTLPKAKIYAISSNDVSNQIIVTGPADIIAKAKDLVEKKIDIGTRPVPLGEAKFITYQTGGGNAEVIATELRKIFTESATLRISAAGTNAIRVYATPQVHDEILSKLNIGDGVKSKLLSMGTLDAKSVATMLVTWLGEAKTGAPNIEAFPDNNTILVRGNQTQIEEVEAIIRTLSATGGAGGVENMIVLTTGKGSGVSIGEEVVRVLNQSRPGQARFVPLTGDPTIDVPRPMDRVPERPMDRAPERPMEKVPEQSRRLSDGLQFVNHQPDPAVDPRKAPMAPNVGKPGAPVIISAAGNKIFFYSEDPAALAAAMVIYKQITQSTATEGDFVIIKLNYAPASEAARILDEAFNGKPQPAQTGRGFNPFGAPQPQAAPREDRIRVVPDNNTNSLLIRATPVDLLTIRKLLRTQIDTDDTNTNTTAMKPFTVGPLKYTNAVEVSTWLKEVFAQQTGSTARSAQVGGFAGFGFGGFGGRGGQQQDTGTKPITLSIGVDDRTNTLLLLCNERMAKDIETLVLKMDDAAKDHQKTVKVISTQGVDPILLQQALTLFGAARPTTGPGSMNQGGQQGGFQGGQPGGFQGGQQGGFQGGQPGGFQGGQPGGFRGGQQGGFPGGQPGGFQGGQPGGNRGGGRGAGGPTGMNVSPGGSGFFADRVKDDPELTDVVFDPHHLYNAQPVNSGVPAGPNADRAPASLLAVNYQEAQPQPMPAAEAAPITGPRANINAVALPEIGLLILTGNTPQDVAEVVKIIEAIREAGKNAAVEIRMVPLEQADATAVTNYLNQLYQRVNLQANGNSATLVGPRTSTTQLPFAQISQTQSQPASVAFIALPRFNAILVAAPKSQIDKVLLQIKNLDVKNPAIGQLTSFALKNTSAARVATLITNFWNQRYIGEGANQHQIRVTSEDITNSVLVQAAPADLEEIAGLIKHIDTTQPESANELRIVTLKTALSDDLAALLQQAINAGIAAPVQQTPAAPTPGVPGVPNAPTPGRPTTTPGATVGTGTKAITLRFVSKLGQSATSLLEDIHIISEPRTNSLLISAPEKTMQLLLNLIAELDVPPKATAVVKVYTLKKGNAATMANMLQQLFLGTGPSSTTTGAPRAPGAPGAPTVTTTSGTGQPLSFSISGVTPEGAPIISVRLTTDDRSNSIIYAGSENDVRIIEALLSKLDNSDVEERRNEVYALRNASAADVANSLNTFFSGNLGVASRGGILTTFEDYQREVVVVPEPITNKLLISASPRFFAEVYRIVNELDSEPPQVVIQVMIAEVDLNGTEEFGVEFGLQSPVLFQRGVIPAANALGNGTISFANAVGGLVPPGVTVNSTTNPAAQPGFNFTAGAPALGNNPLVNPGIVGLQGLGALGVGRVSPTSGVGGFVFSAASDSFNLLIRALKTQGRIDILNGTQIMTLDNQSAGILVGQSVPYVTGSNISALGNVTNNIAYRNVGVQLQVTPKISPDGKVLMRVLPEVSSIAPTTINLGNGVNATAFNVQNVETTVLAQDGETVAIGGLMSKRDQKNENKIPWLGDLPFVGSAFRYRTQLKSKTELIVILTPHVVRNRFDAQRLLCDNAKKMNWCLTDVERLHGPIGLENCSPAGCGNTVDGALPQHPLLPGAIQINPPAETIPQPRMVPVPGPTVPPPQAQRSTAPAVIPASLSSAAPPPGMTQLVPAAPR